MDLNAASESPVSHIGKVFFTLSGRNYVCSANSVSATNGSVVSTAGHCVHGGKGKFASRWIFVPAYENGAAPYGQWAATSFSAPTQWTKGGDITYDTGFVKVAPLNGRTLAQAVGASAVAFNQARGLAYEAFGYPAAAPFDGQTLKSCAGTATADPYGQTQSQGIPCDMTGGSSGGPWFLGSGAQNSLNSFGYNNIPNVMFGPYYGSVAQTAYAAAPHPDPLTRRPRPLAARGRRAARGYRAWRSTKVRSIRLGYDTSARRTAASVGSSSSAAK